jgi:hypothetical protein
MSSIDVRYAQGLWKISPSTDIVTTKPNVVSPTHPPPLRNEIAIKHPGVQDIPPRTFWSLHKTLLSNHSNFTDINTVTLITGSLDRDRIGERSCALYQLHEYNL